MANYTTEQMTALTTISETLKVNELTVDDLPEVMSEVNGLKLEVERLKLDAERLSTVRKNFTEFSERYSELLYKIIPKFYKNLVDNTSPDIAYDWVESNIFADFPNWREAFASADIKRRRYKVVDVSLSLKVIMPDAEYEGDWDDYADVDSIDWSMADTNEVETGLTRSEAKQWENRSINSVDDVD